MFKKIAHNSTIPSLGPALGRSNQDLQNLIAAEKTVLLSLQKLSIDYSKASEALRVWGLNEGDDLEGILGASTTILNHFSSALSQYAAHGNSMRDQLKAIRTREESLDDLERRRRSLLRKVEDADKKLSKMSSENKHFSMQSDTLNRFREDVRAMDSEIMLGEAGLSDFKRSATKVWMGLKFGGLVECCQKGVITGEFGRLAIAEISEGTTQPGLTRSFHYPHDKIENFVAEAYRGVNMVTLSTFPSSSDAPAFYIMPTGYEESSNIRSLRLSSELPPFPTPIFHDDQSNHQATQHNVYPPGNSSFSRSSQQLGVNEGAMDDFGRSTGLRHQQQSPQDTVNSSFSQTSPSSQHSRANEGAVDDFGVDRSAGPPYQQQLSPYPSFSQTSPSSQQFGGNEGPNVGSNVRSAPPYSGNRSFSQASSSSQQLGGHEGPNFGAKFRSAAPFLQQFSEKSGNPSFSPASPSSQQLVGGNEGPNFSANVRSAPPYQQQFSEKSGNPLFSPASSSSQRLGGNEGDSVRSAPPYQQQFSEKSGNPVMESAVDNFGTNFRSNGPPHQQQYSQGSVDSSFSQKLSPSQQLGVNEETADNFGRSTGPSHQQQLYQEPVDSFQTLASGQQPRISEGAMNDFSAHSTGPTKSSDAAGGRLATFPVQTRPPGSSGGYSLQDPPSRRHPSSDEKCDGPNSQTNLLSNRFNDGSQLPVNSEATTRRFQVPVGTNQPLTDETKFATSLSHPPPEGSSRASSHSRSSQASEYHDAVLSYMPEDSGRRETPTKTAVPFSGPPPTITTTTTASSPNTNNDDSRHMRFGGMTDVDQETEQRVSWEKEQAANFHVVGTYPMEGSRDRARTGEMNVTKNNPPQQTMSNAASRRVPPPSIKSWEEDEKALNAAAAREISLELEALKNNNQNQVPSHVDPRFQSASSPDVDGGRTMMASSPRSNNQQSPHPYAELNPPGTYPHYVTPQPYVQAAYPSSPDSHPQSFEQQQKQQSLDMRNAFPPRFQAYNNIPAVSQVPPRFQNSSSSPTANPLPPRFQTSYTP